MIVHVTYFAKEVIKSYTKRRDVVTAITALGIWASVKKNTKT